VHIVEFADAVIVGLGIKVMVAMDVAEPQAVVAVTIMEPEDAP
jgi:hypothetical protein